MKGQIFRDLVSNKDEPLSIFGTVNAYSSILAKTFPIFSSKDRIIPA